MLKCRGYYNHLPISNEHLGAIQDQDGVTAEETDGFELVGMPVQADQSARWDAHCADTRQRIINRAQQRFHINSMKTRMFLPFSSREIGNSR